jgi:hypothetical protein
MLQNRWNLILVALICLAGLSICAAQEGKANETSLTTDQIVARMTERNEQRAAALKAYSGRRVYQLHYQGFPRDQEAELVAEMRYSAPSTKEFHIVSQTGSKFIGERVLKRLVTSEQEAQNRDNRQETALTARNYTFSLVSQETTPNGRVYVLKVEPKHRNKFLYRGEVWIDARDFAVVRIEAEPAKSPSFWLSKTLIEQQYAKVGLFWLPVHNQSTSYLRIGGHATLTIDYQNYVVLDQEPASVRAESSGGNVTAAVAKH